MFNTTDMGNDSTDIETDLTVYITEIFLQNSSQICKDHVNFAREYEPYTATVCALYSIFGVLCAFFGYRCFKAIMFLYGFIFGSLIVYFICAEEAVLPEWSNAVIALSAGLLFGLITMLVQYVGLFMLGLHTGLLLGLISVCFISLSYTPPTPWLALGVLLAAGLLCALLTLYFQKSLTIFGSSFYGGAVLMSTLDYFIEDSLVISWLWQRIKVEPKSEQQEVFPLCWVAWVITAVWPAVFLLGLLIQACCTGKGIHHDQGFSQVKYRKQSIGESKEERKQRKYRYLYQVRTCHGDVISQVNRPIPGKYVQHVDPRHC